MLCCAVLRRDRVLACADLTGPMRVTLTCATMLLPPAGLAHRMRARRAAHAVRRAQPLAVNALCMSRFRDQTAHTAHQKMFLRKWGEWPGRVPFRAIPPISAKIRYGERWSRFDPGTLKCSSVSLRRCQAPPANMRCLLAHCCHTWHISCQDHLRVLSQ